MIKGLFVTGTDTNVGKTAVAAALVAAARLSGRNTVGVKPVASGAQMREGTYVNEDALALQAAAEHSLSYHETNPVCLEPAIAPHIAAMLEGRRIELAGLVNHVADLAMTRDVAVIVEGAGGWRVPLNEDTCFSALAAALCLPVLLVVDVRLGCINHSILTAEAVRRDGCVLAGWVANKLQTGDPVEDLVIESLQQRLGVPCWGRIPLLESTDPEGIIPFVDTALLLAALG